MKLGRPVKWTETRRENYQATTHGRDHVQEVELAATKDGKILGLRVHGRGRAWARISRRRRPASRRFSTA